MVVKGKERPGARRLEAELAEKASLLASAEKKLVDLSSIIVANTTVFSRSLSFEDALKTVLEAITGLIGAEACSLLLVGETGTLFSMISLGPVGEAIQKVLKLEVGEGIAGWVFKTGEAVIVNDPYNDKRFCAKFDQEMGFETKSILCLPLMVEGETIGVAQVINKAGGFTEHDKMTATLFCNQAAVAIRNAKRYDEYKKNNELKEKENVYLRGQLRRKDDIVGESVQMKNVRSMIDKVRNSPYPVLVRGESGTGKELIAKATHYGSPRSDKPFVAINCAAIPRELLESELFGYEKGAFTGAGQRKLGIFEVANGGTLFLDEVGDMNLSSQSKILRILQEKEFQRVGGTENIKVDVRIIAATEKDLSEEIKNGNFREALYYRLNVVPIHVPPLRERKGDISLLANWFLEKSSVEVKKHFRGFSPDCLLLLNEYDWPGNIRELQNVVERLVTLTPDGEVIEADELPPEISGLFPAKTMYKYKSLGSLYAATARLEKNMILESLRATKGNKSKTASLLGISRKVLYDKIAQHNIKE
ncbi:MAG: sigma 54-interacting transcriptional regulator [Candidatus Brocadiales bacterium]